ncbi:MAG: hypothetical protein GY719_03740 [bacterium]|nr:hypothetical protein [bacterium]
MRLSKDIREFIELLNSTSVEYLLVGGHAVGYHGFPRMTGDFDFFVRASHENALRLIEVFRQFGFADADKLLPVFTTVGRAVKIATPPDRIDVITGISGVDFDDAWSSREPAELDGPPVSVISREVLLKSKRASARPKDLLDVAEIERLGGE